MMNLRLVTATLVSLVIFSCSKDPVQAPVPKVCQTEKYFQGQNTGKDTVLTLGYNSQGLVSRISRQWQAGGNRDSFLMTYNTDKLVAELKQAAASETIAKYEYSGNKLVKMKLTKPTIVGDSIVYTYQYNGGDKPSRKNTHVYSGGTGGLVGYVEYEYDPYRNISVIRNFGGDPGSFATANFTYRGTENSFKYVAHAADAFNILNATASMYKDVVWNDFNLDKAVFRNLNGDIVREVRMHYEFDTDGNVTTLRAKGSQPGSTDTAVYTYRVDLLCK